MLFLKSSVERHQNPLIHNSNRIARLPQTQALHTIAFLTGLMFLFREKCNLITGAGGQGFRPSARGQMNASRQDDKRFAPEARTLPRFGTSWRFPAPDSRVRQQLGKGRGKGEELAPLQRLSTFPWTCTQRFAFAPS